MAVSQTISFNIYNPAAVVSSIGNRIDNNTGGIKKIDYNSNGKVGKSEAKHENKKDECDPTVRKSALMAYKKCNKQKNVFEIKGDEKKTGEITEIAKQLSEFGNISREADNDFSESGVLKLISGGNFAAGSVVDIKV